MSLEALKAQNPHAMTPKELLEALSRDVILRRNVAYLG